MKKMRAKEQYRKKSELLFWLVAGIIIAIDLVAVIIWLVQMWPDIINFR